MLPFFQGGALHYLIRPDVNERIVWLALVDLDPVHDRDLVTSLLRAHPRGLKRVDGSSFTANGIVVEGRYGWDHAPARTARFESDRRRITLHQKTPVRRAERKPRA